MYSKELAYLFCIVEIQEYSGEFAESQMKCIKFCGSHIGDKLD